MRADYAVLIAYAARPKFPATKGVLLALLWKPHRMVVALENANWAFSSAMAI